MDVRIGVTYTPKEVALEMADDIDVATVQAAVEAALTGEQAVLWLEDRKGNRVAVPSDKISYVEIGSDDANRPIGFG